MREVFESAMAGATDSSGDFENHVQFSKHFTVNEINVIQSLIQIIQERRGSGNCCNGQLA